MCKRSRRQLRDSPFLMREIAQDIRFALARHLSAQKEQKEPTPQIAAWAFAGVGKFRELSALSIPPPYSTLNKSSALPKVKTVRQR